MHRAVIDVRPPRKPSEATIALLDALARGKDVTAAAAVAGISVRSARRQLARLRRDWSCRNNIALVVTAVRRDLI